MRNDTPRLRIGIIGIVAVSLFGALFARLWYLQILAAPEYRLQATANQQRVIIEPAPRGRILDRWGHVLVDNRLSYIAAVDRHALGNLDDAARADVLGRLVAQLQPVDSSLTLDELQSRLGSDRYSPYTPVPVAEDIPETLAVYLTEHASDFDGVLSVAQRAIRHYQYGRLASHVLGYVGAINDEEFAARQDGPGQYQLTDEIGKSGVERAFESDLRGTPGIRVLEVDRSGNTVSQLSYTPPVAGHDVYLTIDATVQAVAEQALKEELAHAAARPVRSGEPNVAQAGSVVVEDPTDGSIVAMASYPDFDPSTFTDGIDPAEWANLNSDASFHPFINRAIQGEYAPGSTFKLVTAVAALKVGEITPDAGFHDPGYYVIPNCRGAGCTKNNAGREAHGTVNLAQAITVSSDSYFYRIGAELWFNRPTTGDPIQATAHDFGFGSDTGIALADERAGRILTPEQFAQRHIDNPEAFQDGDWQAGDNVNMAIGQGDVLVTPLQLANAYGALANGGDVHAPNIVMHVNQAGSDEVVRTYDPRVNNHIDLDPSWSVSLWSGFVGVTQSAHPLGTAYATFRGFPEGWVVAGKTGTAQNTGKADNALFVGFGPAGPGQTPRYVAAAVLEQAGFGGVAAAPVVRRIFAPLADSNLMPLLQPGGTLSEPLAGQDVNPLAEGDVLD